MRDPIKRAEYMRKWWAAHPGRALELKKRWSAANPEKIKESRRKDYLKHADAYKARATKWHYANADHKRELMKNWSASNPERRSEILREWRANNPERNRVISNKYYSNKKAATTEDCAEKIKELMTHETCFWCHGIIRKFAVTIDHVIPLSRGGKHSSDNLVASCQKCNCSKGSKLASEWKPMEATDVSP